MSRPRQTKRDRQWGDQATVPYFGVCDEHGKRRYLSKYAAKTAIKRYHPDGHMSAYRCGDYWHIGNMPPSVSRGMQDRPEHS